MATTKAVKLARAMRFFEILKSETILTENERRRPIERAGKISDALLMARRLAKMKKVALIEQAIYIACTYPEEYHIRDFFKVENKGVFTFTDMSRLVFEYHKKYIKVTWIRRSGSAWFHSVWSYNGPKKGDERLF